MIAPAMLAALSVALLVPEHAVDAPLNVCDKDKTLTTCKASLEYYYGTYTKAVTRKDTDEQCKDMLYGATSYLELTVVEVRDKLPYDDDAHNAAALYDAVTNNCPDKYGKIVQKIEDVATAWKDGDRPLETQAVEIVEGRSVESAYR